jgi:hypothetical protein
MKKNEFQKRGEHYIESTIMENEEDDIIKGLN